MSYLKIKYYSEPHPSTDQGWTDQMQDIFHEILFFIFLEKVEHNFCYLCHHSIMSFSSPTKRSRSQEYTNHDYIVGACTSEREVTENVHRVPIVALADLSDDVRRRLPSQGTVVVKKCDITAYMYEVNKMQTFTSVAPTLYMAFRHHSNFYIVMEEFPGQTLAQWLMDGNVLCPSACEVLVNTLVQAGCHHWDLNFGNIIVHEDMFHVIDFGPIPYRDAITHIEPTDESRKNARVTMMNDIMSRWESWKNFNPVHTSRPLKTAGRPSLVPPDVEIFIKNLLAKTPTMMPRVCAAAVWYKFPNIRDQGITQKQLRHKVSALKAKAKATKETTLWKPTGNHDVVDVKDDVDDCIEDAVAATPTLLFAAPSNQHDGFDTFFNLFRYRRTASLSTRDMVYLYTKWCRDNQQPHFVTKKEAINVLSRAANNRGYGYDANEKLFTGCLPKQHIPMMGGNLTAPIHKKRVSRLPIRFRTLM